MEAAAGSFLPNSEVVVEAGEANDVSAFGADATGVFGRDVVVVQN